MYTGVQLPEQRSAASGWALSDYRSVRARTEPAVDGTAQLSLGQLGPEELWLVDHAVVACSSSSPTVLRLYDSVVDDLALLDGSASGNFDVADWPAGLQVRPTTSLVACWTDVTGAARGVLNLQLRVLMRR